MAVINYMDKVVPLAEAEVDQLIKAEVEKINKRLVEVQTELFNKCFDFNSRKSKLNKLFGE